MELQHSAKLVSPQLFRSNCPCGFLLASTPGTPSATHAGDFFKTMSQARVDNSVDGTFRLFLSPDLFILDHMGR